MRQREEGPLFVHAAGCLSVKEPSCPAVELLRNFGHALGCVEHMAYEEMKKQGWGADEIFKLFKALQHCTRLQELWLHDNEIGDAGTKHLAEYLRDNTTLQELVLNRNNIGPAGAKHLGEALKYHTTLKTLSLLDNKICASA